MEVRKVVGKSSPKWMILHAGLSLIKFVVVTF